MSLLTWPWRLVTFLGWFVVQLVISNVAVVADILTRTDRSAASVLAHRTSCRSEAEVALLSVLVSLTPGTLVLATRSDSDPLPGWTLFVHSMDGDVEGIRTQLATMEERMLHAIRKEVTA
ncbi:MAG: Na+/H+ antiporter subunit E [Luteococcus japonicus]